MGISSAMVMVVAMVVATSAQITPNLALLPVRHAINWQKL